MLRCARWSLAVTRPMTPGPSSGYFASSATTSRKNWSRSRERIGWVTKTEIVAARATVQQGQPRAFFRAFLRVFLPAFFLAFFRVFALPEP